MTTTPDPTATSPDVTSPHTTGPHGAGPDASSPHVAGPTPGPTAAVPVPAERSPRGPHIDPARPFGAHIRTRWWAAPIVVVIIAVVLLGSQLAAITLAAVIENVISGREFTEPGLTPLMMLAVNLSIALLAPIALLLLRGIGGVPWRSAFAVGRPFAWARLLRSALVMLPVILIVLGLGALGTPVPALSIGGTAVALILVALFTTPLQAASEEIVFRGVLNGLFGAWFRNPRLAVAIGIAVSSVLFGISHGSTDPWLAAYYTFFGVCGALMALGTGGLEAPIAFHAMNNTLLMILTAISMGDGGVQIDRSVGAGGPFMLVFMGMDALLVVIVLLLERRRRRRERAVGVPVRADAV